MTSDTTTVSPTSQALIAAFQAAPNNRLKLAYSSSVDVAAKHKGTVKITKYVEGYYIAGIDYASLPSVADAIAKGEREEVKSLPWGEWVAFPWIIRHKDVEYIRLYPVEGEKPSVRYETRDGQGNVVHENTDKCIVATYLTPANSTAMLSDEPSKKLDCITKRVEHLQIVTCPA